MNKSVYIVDGTRTPFLKSLNRPGPFSASDLAVAASQRLLGRAVISIADIDEVIVGCVMPSENEANIARLVALRLGCPLSTPAWSVQRNCASGMQALACASDSILLGRSHLVLAGGTEAMSRAPLIVKPKMAEWFAEMSESKGFLKKCKQLLKLRPSHLSPIIAILNGLSDPLVKLSMGQTAENVAFHFGIERAEMDQFSLESHHRVAKAFDEGFYDLTRLCDREGHAYKEDTGLRRDTTVERLSTLKPIFDKPFGLVTAGNSSQVTDGSAMLLLASHEAVEKFHLPIIAKIKATHWAGCDPKEMGLGPAYAIPPLLQSQSLAFSDIDYWEINEAFAAQVLGCERALQDKDFCKKELGLEQPFGVIDSARLNIHGGAIALGHPVGASGARIVLELAHTLAQKNARFGVASLCIGGGQGGAMLIENMTGDHHGL